MQQKETGSERIRLPQPKWEGRTSIEQALHERRSIRDYKKGEALALDEVAQILWAAQGITHPDGFRTAASAGALYPLEAYLVAFNVRNLSAGIYQYRPREHELVRVAQGDFRKGLARAALDQEPLESASAVIVFSGVYSRTTKKYHSRGERYVHFEVGHAAQNVYLQAAALNLGTVAIGAFNDADVKRLLLMKADEEPLYLMPIGRKY